MAQTKDMKSNIHEINSTILFPSGVARLVYRTIYRERTQGVISLVQVNLEQIVQNTKLIS